MAESEMRLTVNVPGQEDAGFIGFLDDMMNVVDLTDGEQMTPEAWGAMLAFVEGCIDAPDPRVAIRALNMPQLLAVFEQIVEVVNVEKKE